MPFQRASQHRLVVILSAALLGATVLVIGLQRRALAASERQASETQTNLARQRLDHVVGELRRLFDGAVLETLFAASAEVPSTEELQAIARQLDAGHRYPYVDRFFLWNHNTQRIAPGEVMFLRRSGEAGVETVEPAIADRTAGDFFRLPDRGRLLAKLAGSFGNPSFRVSYAVVDRTFDGIPYEIVVRWWWTGGREQPFAVSGFLVNLKYIRTRFFPDVFEGELKNELVANGLSPSLFRVRDDEGRLVFGEDAGRSARYVERPLEMVFFPVTARPTRLVASPSPRSWTVGLRVPDAAEMKQLSLAGGYWLSGGAVCLILIALGLSISANREAVRLAELRADLVSSVTHELRTPLSLLNLAGETMAVARVQDPDRIDEYIGVVRRESAHLMKLVDNTLELSRIESGGRALHLEVKELNELVSHVVSRFQDRLADRQMPVRIQTHGAEIWARVDAMALEHALFNLLDNAVRYGASSSGVDVFVRPAGAFAAIDVVDYGVGIPSSDIPYLFDKFFRGSNNGSARSGFGLGLSIVQQMIEAHRGRIEVVSTPGESTRFRLLIRPVASAARGHSSRRAHG